MRRPPLLAAVTGLAVALATALGPAAAAAPVEAATVDRTGAAAVVAVPVMEVPDADHDADVPRDGDDADEAPPAAVRPTTTTLDVTGGLGVGDDVTLTATVRPVGATGTVTFRSGTTPLGTAEVRDGTASTTVRLPPGTHRLTVDLVPGSAAWHPSTSPGVVVEVARATSTATLTVSDRATAFGEGSRATVRVHASTGSPSGTVEVRAGERVVASGHLVTVGRTGTAHVDLPRDLPVGGHRLRAVYVGDDDVTGSTSGPVRVRVTPATPDVRLATRSWTVPDGSRPTVTVTVDGRAGAPAPTGVVTVLLNLRRVDSVRLGSDGAARVTLPAVRSRALVTALYGGDAGHHPAVQVRGLRVR